VPLNTSTDPETSPVLESDHYAPFARRSFNAILGIVVVLLLCGGFVYWYFGSPEQSAERRDPVLKGGSTQFTNNPYPEDTGKGSLYEFFRNAISGTADGIDNSSLNFPANRNEETIDAVSRLSRNAELLSSIDDNYMHSIYDVVGSEVVGIQGDEAGKIHDIFVNRDTGEAKAILVDEDGVAYERELVKLKFEKVFKQDTDGDTKLSVTDNDILEKKEFIYSDLEDADYVSLRHLRDGQILDYQGKVAGKVDAIIYENAEAQKIYFALKPKLSPTGQVEKFGIPFESVDVVVNPDGYDIKLNKEQTEAIAETLFK